MRKSRFSVITNYRGEDVSLALISILFYRAMAAYRQGLDGTPPLAAS